VVVRVDSLLAGAESLVVVWATDVAILVVDNESSAVAAGGGESLLVAIGAVAGEPDVVAAQPASSTAAMAADTIEQRLRTETP
jgi:hypothetical protein